MIQLLFLLQIQAILAGFTSCEVNPEHPEIIYPSNSNSFLQPLDKYFHGQGLTYSINGTYQFGVSQSTKMSTITLKKSQFPENTIFIDDAAYFNWSNPNYQQDQFLALVSINNEYYVYETSLNQKTPTWIQLTSSFSSTSTAICTNVAYVFDNDIIKGRISNILLFPKSSNQNYNQIFANSYTVSLRIRTSKLIRIFLFANTEQSRMYLFEFNMYLEEFYAAVVHANYFNPETIVHIFKLEFQRSLHEPIKMTVYFSGHHDKAAYGAYLADPDKIYLLFFDALVIHDFSKKIHKNVMIVVDSSQGMGVYRESYTNGEYNLFISIVTKKGLDFYSTSNLQSNQKPGLPKTFDTNKRLSVKVSLLYTVITTDSSFVIYENRYLLKEEKVQYGFLYYSQTPALLSVFYGFGSQFVVFQNTTIITYQIQMPYLYSLKTLNTNYNVPIQISINATSQDGTQCSCTFNYELLNVNDMYNFVALTKPDGKAEPILLFNSQSKLLPLGDQFFGSNLKYKIETTQLQEENSTIETLQPNTTLLYINQVNIISNNYVIAYSSTYQVDDDTFFIFSQLTTNSKNIQIEKCKFLACQIIEIIKGEFTTPVVGITAIKSGLLFHIVIATQQEIFSFEYDYDKMKLLIQRKKQVTKLTKDIPPTMVISSVNYVQEALIILTSTPNSIICVDNLLIHQYTIAGNQYVPRQVFLNPYIFNDTYFVDNQYELLMIQNSKNNFDIEQETQKKYHYNIFVAFNYPNKFKQQQISIGLVREGVYLIQLSQTATTSTQNIYFYPYQFLYYDAAYKASASFQTISLTQFQLTISQPFVTGISNNDKFYVAVQTNQANQYQLVVLNPSTTEYSQIYQIINLNQPPQNLNIISINRGHNQQIDKVLDFKYDLLFLSSSISNEIQQLQVFKEPAVLYTPNIQQNRVDVFELQVIAENNFNQAPAQEAAITRQVKSTKQEIGIIARENQAFTPMTVLGSIFYLNINPADYFFGYISNYTAINKIGLKVDFNEAFIDCYQKDKKHQAINNSVVQPITRQQANFSLVYTSVTSGIIAGQDTIQTFLQSGRAIYILNENDALFLYTVPAYIDATCIYTFITSDSGYLITVCSNKDDTYFYYYNGTESNNRTILGFSGYQLLKQTAYPNLKSAQFQYNILALEYSQFILTVNVSASNSTLELQNATQYNLVYPLKSYSLFVVDAEELELQSRRNKTLLNRDFVKKFLSNMDAGVIILYENSVLQFLYKSIAKYGAYQSQLPNGVQIQAVTSISIGWITNTYLSTPFLISTTSNSYLFQVTLPIIERSGSAQVDLIYKLISFAKYQTLGVYSGGEAIVGFFYTESNELGVPEYVFGLYGIPTLKDFTKDLTLKVAFNPNKVYQHVGSPVGFIGIQNLTKYNISNPIITNNQTILYQVNQTEFQYLFVTNEVKITVNQVQCINTSTINHALNMTEIELVAYNNYTDDFSRNSFVINNVYPDYTFWVTEKRRRNFWWQFGVGAIFFFVIIGVLIVLCVNSNKIIVYQERILQNELEQ
ncbi:unnamed protein product (macronuclear) [Paramecium tetraurelia]|uniref:Transmembrane protein n=1 Tax=Paramecium tetraurelia TaxID=5888 RepID=A0BCC0_PARTE|nr:uncharacterized protein GSPATT00004281001 [Paramecium tetraurelia]CAK56187.1 unnamed protein product [Paramecium tetraurelia]|eukprot:XP_001423585.1 hypothetical protein (macronuclear) [Paramecium tetraurelia strain d4-2]